MIEFSVYHISSHHRHRRHALAICDDIEFSFDPELARAPFNPCHRAYLYRSLHLDHFLFFPFCLPVPTIRLVDTGT
jgi:hypothetical protein